MLVLCESLILPLIGTAAGAACVFLTKKRERTGGFAERMLVGFSAGLMTAASFFSLLMSALETESGFFPSLIGFVIGIVLLSLLDRMLSAAARRNRESKPEKITAAEEENAARPGSGENMSAPPAKSTGRGERAALGFLAVLLHNIPEGMAVGAILAGFFAGRNGSAEVLALSVGIAVQNFPDGAIVSLPFRTSGMGRGRAFLFGLLSGAVEPLAALLTVLISGALGGVLPYFLSFAAGAMIYVVVRELIPETEGEEQTAMPAFTVGFILLMLLDRFFAG